jgi:hypothetical protein
MAGISKIGELEARKRALVTESEICREALKAEIENLRIQTGRYLRQVDRLRSIRPWLTLAVPLAIPFLGSLFRKHPKGAPQQSGIKGRIATALMALRLYRKYGPLVRGIIGRVRARQRAAAEARSPAANI